MNSSQKLVFIFFKYKLVVIPNYCKLNYIRHILKEIYRYIYKE